MSQPTPEQQAVLDSTARVRIVRAAPGSGKTWLVAELIKRELGKWDAHHQGIAALSFTRVGGEEIRRAVGHNLAHPHYVGTLDAFVFRFVVRPFLKQVFPEMALPRLIPADWEPKEWNMGRSNRRFHVTVGEGQSKKDYNLFRIHFIGETQEGEPIIAYKRWDWKPMEILDQAAQNAVRKAKRENSKKLCWLTHSDVARLASQILGHNKHGSLIRAEVLRRFPLIIVDELQDTGCFLGKCVSKLLSELSARGVLVGDPDQAIYEFNGARPDLFDHFNRIPGAVELPLGHSRRCPPSICVVADQLAGPGRHIEPSSEHTGRALLLCYANLESDISQLRDVLVAQSDGMIVKIVSRQTKTVDRIIGLSRKDYTTLRSVPLNHWHRSINHFRQGRQSASLAASKAALEHAVFGHEGITQDELLEQAINPAVWKRLCVEILLEANREVLNENFGSWGDRLIAFVNKQVAPLLPKDPNGDLPAKIAKPKGKLKSKARKDYLAPPPAIKPSRWPVSVQTVHAVKGQTHDMTVFVCSDTSNENLCPSLVWWSNADSDAEERRIAFVAVTRTRGDLVVCVSESCMTRLKANRLAFVKAFECMSVQEYITIREQRCDQCGSVPKDTKVLPASALMKQVPVSSCAASVGMQ
jgi:DNA helicase-2/ATP-dependent DNA helicase PcrA